MKKFIQKWILHNLIYKIIALAIAFVVWVTFTYSDDPIKTYSVEAAVTVLHADEYAAQGRYIAINGTDDFTNMKEIVFLRGRSSVLDILRNKAVSSYMNVYVDLYELESDENRLLIHYEMLDPSINAELYSIRNKSYYEVEVEESVSKDIPVKYVIIGKPAEGYMFFEDDPEIMVSPSSITISGPEKQVEDIASAQVTVNVANASANVNKTGILVLQNTNGEPVTYSRDVIWASISEAAVFVPSTLTRVWWSSLISQARHLQDMNTREMCPWTIPPSPYTDRKAS